MPVEASFPINQVSEIDWWGFNKVTTKKKIIDLIKSHFYLTWHVWVLLIMGYLFMAWSFYNCFYPASSGAVLVVLGAIAEWTLVGYWWQDLPAKVKFSYIRVWKHRDGNTRFTYSPHHNELYQTNSNLMNGNYKWYNREPKYNDFSHLVTLSKFQHSSPFAFEPGTIKPEPHTIQIFGAEKAASFQTTKLAWDIKKTVRHMSFIPNLVILFTIVIGTFVWGYYEWFHNLIPFFKCCTP